MIDHIDCIHFGMYGDCTLVRLGIQAAYDKNGVCLFCDNPASECFCIGSYQMDDTKNLIPVGSTEGVWKYAHPSDVGIFLDGTYGWFIRHPDYLDWEPLKLKKWLSGKPANIFKIYDKGPAIIVRKGYMFGPR